MPVRRVPNSSVAPAPSSIPKSSADYPPELVIASPPAPAPVLPGSAPTSPTVPVTPLVVLIVAALVGTAVVGRRPLAEVVSAGV